MIINERKLAILGEHDFKGDHESMSRQLSFHSFVYKDIGAVMNLGNLIYFTKT